jgi:hypothetical protein
MVMTHAAAKNRAADLAKVRPSPITREIKWGCVLLIELLPTRSSGKAVFMVAVLLNGGADRFRFVESLQCGSTLFIVTYGTQSYES